MALRGDAMRLYDEIRCTWIRGRVGAQPSYGMSMLRSILSTQSMGAFSLAAHQRLGMQESIGITPTQQVWTI